MIKPVNGHIVIEPVVHDSFMASQRETYQEIGTVLAVANGLGDSILRNLEGEVSTVIKGEVNPGDKVYFDAWLAAKYPKEDGKDGEFYWLVKWEDVRAIENVKSE